MNLPAIPQGSSRDRLLAHGLGGSTDLPIPYAYAVIGAVWALTISFVVLAFAWRTTRLDAGRPGRRLSPALTVLVEAPITRAVLETVALAFSTWVALAAFGGGDAHSNPLPGVLYVFVWVGLVPLSLLFGHVWSVISPVRIVHRLLCRLTRRDPHTAWMTYPDRLGYWPAALGLFAFVWVELVSPDPGSVATVRTWCVVYAVSMLAGAFMFGARWFERADPFDVYAALVARLSPFRRAYPGGGERARRGWLVVGNPLDNLDGLEGDRGLIAVVATLLGATAYDSFSASRFWMSRSQQWAGGSDLAASALNTAAMLALIVFVSATFWLAARAAGGLPHAERRALPGLLAHSLVPIVVGYVFAHYLTYLVEKGQATAILLADPLGRGWNLFGLGDTEVSFWLSGHPGLLATSKVAFVLAGHVLAVIAAHDRSVRVLPPGHQLSGQLALLIAMVTYTFGGLYLLFSV